LVSAAHEFKTPLVVMLGYAELLRSGSVGSLNEKQRGMLAEIQENAERLQRLIHDLLLLCELRATKGPRAAKENPGAADVNENMRELFEYWAPVARQRSLEYQFCPAEGGPRVHVEPLKLQHIVSNLIENALNYTPRNGRVVVSVAECFWDRRKTKTGSLFSMERKINRKIKNAVCISVSDSGPGIAPEHHHDIFADFVQLPGASARGTGLGLAIARRLVEAHRGVIWVESELGKGSKFLLLLSKST
jgi:signal transduction histidine kinase